MKKIICVIALSFSLSLAFTQQLQRVEHLVTEQESQMSRDEWEWAVRAIMAYKTLYQYDYYPTYDEYALKYTNVHGLKTIYEAECLGNLQTQKLRNKAADISFWVGMYLTSKGSCSAQQMAEIVRVLSQED